MQRLKSPSNVNSVTPSFQFNVPIANRFECLTSQTNFIQLWLFTAYDNKTVVNHFSINDATETHRTTNAMAFHCEWDKNCLNFGFRIVICFVFGFLD